MTADYENPWIFEGHPFLSEDINDYFGFVYRITNLQSGRQYIGRKYFWQHRKPRGGGRRVKSESDWKNTTEALTNLIGNANRWGMMPMEEKSYQSTSLKGPATLKRPNNSSYIMF